VCKPSVVGVARAGVVSVPPIGASGIQSLAVQPAATTIAISVAIIAGPPPDTDCHEAVVEAIVEVAVMGEAPVVVVPSIVAAMPFPGPIMPGIVATTDVADMPATTTPAPTRIVATATTPSEVASMPAAAAKVATSSTHATEVATSATASHATTTVAAATMADEGNLTVWRAERTLQVGNAGVCLTHYGRGEKQAACEGSHCGNTHSHD
jgi:hypothetical protein